MQTSSGTKAGPTNGFTTVSKNHLFYMNPKENNVKPPWFINCSRKDAEEILKKHREFGNVLIRPNSHFAVNGSYALSAVTISNGENKYVHYVISRSTNGFMLEVQSKPAPMSCLKDVLDFYIHAAGCQNHHAMVVDPTEVANAKNLHACRDKIGLIKNDDYMNQNEPVKGRPTSDPVDDYMPMDGPKKDKSTHAISRRCSAPVNKRDYVNMPKATGANPKANDLYVNGNELNSDSPRGRDGHHYINVANVIPGRPSGSSRSPMPKANSFPVPKRGGGDDDDDNSYLVPQFSEDIRPSSIHDPPGY